MEDRHSGKRLSSRTVRSRRRSSPRFKIAAWLLAIGSVLGLVLLVGVAVYIVSKHSSGPADPATATAPIGNRLTLENFRRLRYGMSYDQVVAIMGPPQFDDTNTYANGSKSRNLGWNNGRDSVFVQFFNDANKANVVCATFDRANYNAPKP